MLADLEAIEWWPMSLDEVERIRTERIAEVATAIARNQHHPAVYPTEPYAGQINALRDIGSENDAETRSARLNDGGPAT